MPRTILDLAAVCTDRGRREPRCASPNTCGFTTGCRCRTSRALPRPARGARRSRICLERRSEATGARPQSARGASSCRSSTAHDLPRPQLNAWLAGRRVDGSRSTASGPSRCTIVELDGWQGHGTRHAFRDDRARDRRLRVAGYGVTRIAWTPAARRTRGDRRRPPPPPHPRPPAEVALELAIEDKATSGSIQTSVITYSDDDPGSDQPSHRIAPPTSPPPSAPASAPCATRWGSRCATWPSAPGSARRCSRRSSAGRPARRSPSPPRSPPAWS